VTRDRKLREVLNVRLDEPLAKEIRRIATAQGRSESEVARQLLGYGAEVERRLEAQRLATHYSQDSDAPAGRIQIRAEFVPYTWEEAREIQERLEGGQPTTPTWDDLIP
jgi:Ribbon-helix-helix protein, copG family